MTESILFLEWEAVDPTAPVDLPGRSAHNTSEGAQARIDEVVERLGGGEMTEVVGPAATVVGTVTGSGVRYLLRAAQLSD